MCCFGRWNQRCRRHRFRVHLLRSKGGGSQCVSFSLFLSISIGSSNPQSREEKKFAGLTKSFLTDDLCPGKGPDLGCLGSPSEL